MKTAKNATKVLVSDAETAKAENGRRVVLCSSPLVVAYIIGNRVLLEMPE